MLSSKSLKTLSVFTTLIGVSMSGCSEPKFPVSGTVAYKGNPVSNANILFLRSDGLIATAKTDSTGTFSTPTTDMPGDGVMAGVYKVGLSDASIDYRTVDEGEMKPSAKPSFPPKYFSTETSGIVVTVVPEMAPIDIILED
jgi:hypothetical protein